MFDWDNISTIFFDLDNTIFDHSRAEQQTLKTLCRTLEHFRGLDETRFVQTYDKVNTRLWTRMANGELTKEELKPLRFELTLNALGTDYPDYDELSARYLDLYIEQRFWVPHARELLDFLRPRYKLAILSNGFPDVQFRKLKNLELMDYFSVTVFSGEVGVMKPHPEIFHAANRRSGTSAAEVLYIGDSYESDVVGASGVGWPVVFLNPSKQKVSNGVANLEVQSLWQLQTLFAHSSRPPSLG